MNSVVKNSNLRNSVLKVMTAAAVVSGFVTSSIVHAGEGVGPEAFRVGLDYSFPRTTDNWDGGAGIRVQALFPASAFSEMSDKYALGLSLGVTSWDVNEDAYSATFNSVSVTGNLSGDARSVNLGASIIRSDTLENGLQLSSEVGLMFSSISSDAKIVYTSSNVTPSEQDLELDNTFSALFALDAKFKANEDITTFVGIGYHFDLGAGDATIQNASADQEKNYTNAVFLRGGIEF